MNTTGLFKQKSALPQSASGLYTTDEDDQCIEGDQLLLIAGGEGCQLHRTHEDVDQPNML